MIKATICIVTGVVMGLMTASVWLGLFALAVMAVVSQYGCQKKPIQ